MVNPKFVCTHSARVHACIMLLPDARDDGHMLKVYSCSQSLFTITLYSSCRKTKQLS
jgi:hypothetical protein